MTTASVIRNVSVFDSTGIGTVHDRSIVIDAGRIRWIGDANGVPEAWLGALAIDGSGLTATAGLFDCHTHLTFDAVPSSFESIETSIVNLTLIAERNMAAQLRSGVTTVRDCGSYNRTAIDLARAVVRGDAIGPRVLAAGLVLTMTGGHGHFIGNLVDGADSATRATRQEIAAGADFIKAMATGGVLTKGVSTGQVGLQEQELRAIVIAAHASGKRVTVHSTGLQGTVNAIAAGVDSIEHAMELTPAVADAAASRGVVLIPTLSAVAGMYRRKESLPEWMAAKVDAARANAARSVGLAIQAGARIAAGTDAGTPFNEHGGLGSELVLLVEAGMSPADALIAATRTSAENLGLDADLGTLEVGKLADIVLFASDPSHDISAVHEVRRVLKEGATVYGTTTSAAPVDLSTAA